MSAPSEGDAVSSQVRAQFHTTHWSVVLTAAHGPSTEARAALEKLCATYWYPLYAFVRREGHSADEAQDLTQAFFARLLERRDFEQARREKGRLRSFLLVALKNFLINEWHRARAEKRGGSQTFIPLDEILAEQRYTLEPVDMLTAERIYERRWALTLLDAVLAQLEAEYVAVGNGALFAALQPSLLGDEGAAPQSEIAARLGTNENALKQAFFRMRQRYRVLLRTEIANTVATPAEVEDELRFLVSVLRQ